jgi:hypothetical protein
MKKQAFAGFCSIKVGRAQLLQLPVFWLILYCKWLLMYSKWLILADTQISYFLAFFNKTELI